MTSIIKRKKMILALLLVLFTIILIQGCGNETTPPALSKITVNQNATSFDTGGGGLGAGAALPFDFTVLVTYPDGNPMPSADLTISGSLAVPNSFGTYQFYKSQWAVGHTDTVDSPFTAKTNNSGVYTFSALVSGPVLTFKDSVYVQSGANVGFGVIELE